MVRPHGGAAQLNRGALGSPRHMGSVGGRPIVRRAALVIALVMDCSTQHRAQTTLAPTRFATCYQVSYSNDTIAQLATRYQLLPSLLAFEPGKDSGVALALYAGGRRPFRQFLGQWRRRAGDSLEARFGLLTVLAFRAMCLRDSLQGTLTFYSDMIYTDASGNSPPPPSTPFRAQVAACGGT